MENWKTVKGFENYEVSTYGKVRRKNCEITYVNGLICNYKEKILKLEKAKSNKFGKHYLRVTLSSKNKVKRFQVHRLVAKTFLPNMDNKPCVNHLDGNPENNNINNLKWCTYSENERHSYDDLGKINNNRELSEEAVKDILANAKKGVNHANRGNCLFFSKKYNVDRSTILNVLNKRYYV